MERHKFFFSQLDRQIVSPTIQRLPEGARTVPWGKEEALPPTTDRTDKGGYNLCVPTDSCYETAVSGSTEKRMDLSSNVETRQRESLHAPGSSEISDSHLEDGTRHKGEPEDGQETAGRGGGAGGRGNVGVRPPSAPGGLATDQGLV